MPCVARLELLLLCGVSAQSVVQYLLGLSSWGSQLLTNWETPSLGSVDPSENRFLHVKNAGEILNKFSVNEK
jgi:hypothetical protein